jgi:hypothetical protein
MASGGRRIAVATSGSMDTGLTPAVAVLLFGMQTIAESRKIAIGRSRVEATIF